MLLVPTDLWQQECIAMTKPAHRAINLANEDVDLVGTFNKHGAVSIAVQCLCVSNLHVKASILLVKH